MMDTLLPNDYILVDKSVYRTREPQRDDVVLFRADTSCRYAHGCDLTTMPPDSYFVMGDNRDSFQDSRYWGFVKREKIKGKAAVIYWSWDRERRWPRWERLGRPIL